MFTQLRNLCAGLVTLGAVALPSAADAQDYPELNLRFALYISENLAQSDNFKQWAAEVKEGSNGKINVDFFWSETLGKASELLDLVSQGAVDIAAPAPGYHTAQLPLVSVTQIPLIFPNAKTAQLVGEAIAETEAVQAEHAKNNVVPIAWTTLPKYHVQCNKPIRTVADFKNLKMRSYGEYLPQLWQSLDAVGVTMLAPEVYEGLQRGNTDCSYLPNDFAHAYKLHEVADYLTTANFGAIIGWPIYINADKWNSWPDHVQRLMLEAGEKVGERDRATIDEKGEQATQLMLESGMQKVEFTEQQELLETAPDFLNYWIGKMEERGLGSEAEDVAKVIRRVVDVNN